MNKNIALFEISNVKINHENTKNGKHEIDFLFVSSRFSAFVVEKNHDSGTMKDENP